MAETHLPHKGVFRGGRVSVTKPYWAPDSIGIFSFAYGGRVSAPGNRAIAFGLDTKASGSNGATALGCSTTASGYTGATALGYRTKALGDVGATLDK